ncbi:MAG: glycosyltransferase family 4 protein [Candidatus Methanosuratincola sp.]
MKPVFAVVSTDIRRDLVVPMRFFSRLCIMHFYRRAPYGDMNPYELDSTLVTYKSPWDLFHKLAEARWNIIQGVEPFSVRLLPYLYAVFGIAVLKGIPFMLATLENRPLKEKFGVVVSWLMRAALRPVFNRAQLIICVNEGAKRNVLSVGPYAGKIKKMMYGTWGVDLEEFSPQRNGNEPNWGAGPILLFVGRLHPEKGIFDLLEAFAIVKDKIPSVKLVLVGDGPARSQIEQLVIKRQWTSSVFLTGVVKNKELPAYFRAADVFVAPSVTTQKWEEQVGMTNIQAMACGVPVVSTRSGAIPEYVPDGIAGILVPERNPQALADAILFLLTDAELRRRMGEAGRTYAIAHYDARRNVRLVEEVILQIIYDQ